MRHLKIYEDFNKGNGILIIVDVQHSFKKFFTDNYLKELNKYCLKFNKVYQIFDNHVDGKNPDKDYLYDSDPDIENKSDLYTFNNQVDLIEKRYNYDVDADFYKKILDDEIYNDIKNKEKNKSLKRGDFFPTTGGTIIVYIANNHQWFHIPKKLYDIFLTLKGKDVTIVGGSDQECYLDIEVSGKILGVNVKRNNNYIYSASFCPIK
jgi:hypothetical protein